MHVGFISFVRLNDVLDAIYFYFNEKKTFGADHFNLKIQNLLQNMQSEHFTRQKKQRVKFVKRVIDSTDDATDSTFVQSALAVWLDMFCFKYIH